MNFISQLIDYNTVVATEKDAKSLTGIDLSVSVFNGKAKNKLIKEWLNADGYDFRGSNKTDVRLYRLLGIPDQQVSTTVGSLSFGPATEIVSDIKKLKENAEDAHDNMLGWLLEGDSRMGRMNGPFFPEPRDVQRFGNFQIACGKNKINIPISSHWQNRYEIATTILNGYMDYLCMLERFNGQNCFLNTQKAVSELSNGALRWDDDNGRYRMNHFTIGGNNFNPELAIREDLSRYRAEPKEVYRTMLDMAIINSIIKFEKDITIHFLHEIKKAAEQ